MLGIEVATRTGEGNGELGVLVGCSCPLGTQVDQLAAARKGAAVAVRGGSARLADHEPTAHARLRGEGASQTVSPQRLVVRRCALVLTGGGVGGV